MAMILLRGGLALGALVVSGLLRQLWLWSGVAAAAATGLAATVAASLLLALGVGVWVRHKKRPPSRADERALVALASLPPGAFAVGGGLALGLSPGISVALAFALIAPQTPRTLRSVRGFSYQCVIRKQGTENVADCERDLEVYADRLSDPKLSAHERAEAEVYRADAQVARAGMGGRREGLHEAFGALTRHASAPAVDERGWQLRFTAAARLVAAWDVHGERHRSAPGYEQALVLLESVVESAPDDERLRAARVALASATITYCAWQVRELLGATSPDPAQVDAVCDRGLATVREALALEPTGSASWVELIVASTNLHVDDWDAGVAELRSVLPYLPGKPLIQRDAAHLALAAMLVFRYEEEPEAHDGHLDEAERLLREVSDGGPMVAHARALLHQIAQLRADASEGRPHERPPADPCEDAREAYARAPGWDVVRVTAMARTWAECAAAHGRVHEAADAYWELVRLLPSELERRYALGPARRLVGEMQGIAAEAGHWLLADGRPQEAVVALELARALLLGQRTTRVPAGLRDELLGRGLTALWARFQDAATRLEAWDREEYGRDPGDAVESDGVAPDRGMAAWSAYRRVVDELRDALGENHALLGDTSIDQVRRAARSAPLVYLFAATDGGGVLVVGRDGRIASRRLPGLTSAKVQAWTERLQQLLRRPEGRVSDWEALLDELARHVVADLTDVARASTSVVVIPVGSLALLPLHAAAKDRLTVRYAPSAKALLAAAEHARPASRTHAITVLGVTDENAPVDEADAVAGLYAEHILVRDPTPAECLKRLGTASAWHFTGHAKASSVDPVQGHLMTAGGPLLLKEVLAHHRGAGTLAVLCACETNVHAAAEVDEALTFPAVLLAAGMRTIVATSWQVDRTAALLFSLRFHRLILAGHDPDEAVASTVAWLRQSDNEALERSSCGHYGAPTWATTPERLRAWRAQKPWSAPFYWAAFTVTGG